MHVYGKFLCMTFQLMLMFNTSRTKLKTDKIVIVTYSFPHRKWISWNRTTPQNIESGMKVKDLEFAFFFALFPPCYKQASYDNNYSYFFTLLNLYIAKVNNTQRK